MDNVQLFTSKKQCFIFVKLCFTALTHRFSRWKTGLLEGDFSALGFQKH